MFKKLLVPALVVAAASVALPAAAQSYGHYNGNHNGNGYAPRPVPPRPVTPPTYRPINQTGWQSAAQAKARLEQRITNGLRDRSLSPAEASRLRAEFNALERLEVRYRAGGLTQWERTDLNRRFVHLSDSIRYERRDWNNYRS